jgi:hypothetical protein
MRPPQLTEEQTAEFREHFQRCLAENPERYSNIRRFMAEPRRRRVSRYDVLAIVAFAVLAAASTAELLILLGIIRN